MLSKNQIKFINSLKQKKFRVQNQLFVAEGYKTIKELIKSSLKLHSLYTTVEFNSYANSLESNKQVLISEGDLNKISFLKTPNKALAIFEIPEPKPIPLDNLVLALDAIQDPGNLGTIIRLCDWFGISDLVCGNDTVDCYNPKVIQATMGSIARVNITYSDLESFLMEVDVPIFGAFMEGQNVYHKTLPIKGILVMGNEANGISNRIESLITEKISIPQFGINHETESLNVATATAILLSEFKRTNAIIEK